MTLLMPWVLFGQLNTNTDFELGTGAGCACATDYTCQNDAGRVVDGVHPVYTLASQGCVTGPTNFTNPLGAHSGTGYIYFYAGADQLNSQTIFFTGGQQVELCVWYAGPPQPGPPGQNTAASHFTFGVDGLQVGPQVPVPAGTGWTQHCFTVTMAAGWHTFNILSGGAAQYSIWFDDFTVIDQLCNLTIDGQTTLCEGSLTFLQAVSQSATSYLWSTGDTGPIIAVDLSGTYWVEVTDACGTSSDTVDVVFLTYQEVSLGNDTIICEGQTLLLDPDLPAATYFWQDGSMDSTFLVTEPGYYYVEAENPCGFSFDDISVDYIPLPVVELGDSLEFCEGSTVFLDATTLGYTYLWSDGSTGPTVQAGTPGIWWVELSGECGVLTDSVVLVSTPLPTVALGNDTTQCEGVSVTFDATYPNATYLWSTGETTPTITVNTTGNYSVTVSNTCGSAVDDINADFIVIPNVDLGPDTVLCQWESLTLDATTPGSTYLWSTGATTPTLTVTTTNTYLVQVTTPCGAVLEDITVTFIPVPDVDLGPDTILCENNVLALDATQPGATYSWQDGSTDAMYFVTTGGTYSVTASTPCGNSTDDIIVDFIPIPTLNLGPDTTLCPGEVLPLDATIPGSTYLWSTGSTTSSIVAPGAGTYTVVVETPCLQLTDEIIVEELPIPVITMPEDTLLCDPAYLFLDVSWEESSYLWQDGNTSPTYTVQDAGIYRVTVSNRCGQDDHRMVVVATDCTCRPFVPNAFTPDGDGINDQFLPIFSCRLDLYEVLIFDRWGELIFSTSDPEKGWDGTYSGGISQDGVYNWRVNYRTERREEGRLRGHVTLLR